MLDVFVIDVGDLWFDFTMHRLRVYMSDVLMSRRLVVNMFGKKFPLGNKPSFHLNETNRIGFDISKVQRDQFRLLSPTRYPIHKNCSRKLITTALSRSITRSPPRILQQAPASFSIAGKSFLHDCKSEFPPMCLCLMKMLGTDR